MPSEKYSFSLSLLMLTNGATAIELAGCASDTDRARPGQTKYPDQARSGREHADADQDQCQPRSTEAAIRRRLCPLDASRVYIEYPSQRGDQRKTDCQPDDHVGQNNVRPAQAMHDWLDDLQDRERRDAVPYQRAKHAPPIQFGNKRQQHRALLGISVTPGRLSAHAWDARANERPAKTAPA